MFGFCFHYRVSFVFLLYPPRARANLTPLVIPISNWFDGIMMSFQLQNWLRYILGLAFQALLIDFPRLTLFIYVTNYLHLRNLE